MKFVYWSGNKLQLERALKQKENNFEILANRLGLDSSRIRISYNYKDQTNSAKLERLKSTQGNIFDIVDIASIKEARAEVNDDTPVSRGEASESKNGTLAIKMNSKLVESSANSRLNNVNQFGNLKLKANIIEQMAASVLAEYGVNKSKAFQILEEEITDLFTAPLADMYIASAIKMDLEEFKKDMVTIGDPYFIIKYGNLVDDDWRDIFDIVNYYRTVYGSFNLGVKEFSGVDRSNHPFNKDIAELEAIYQRFLEIEENQHLKVEGE